MTDNKGKYTKTRIAYFNENQYGQHWSAPLDAAALDALSKAEPGSKLVFDHAPSRDNPERMVHVLQIVPAEEVRAAEAAYAARREAAKNNTPSTIDI